MSAQSGSQREQRPRPASIGRLAADLRARLAEIETERVRIEGALAALASNSTKLSRTQPATRLRSMTTLPQGRAGRILAGVRSTPGIRTSVLAMTLGLPIDTVASELTRLERTGVVSRQARGWNALHPH